MDAPKPPSTEPVPDDESRPGLRTRLRTLLVGPPRDLRDKRVYQHISLIAFLAWVGLGADGLSSSSYGPQEAFRTLGEHTYLAVGLALLTAFRRRTAASSSASRTAVAATWWPPRSWASGPA
jgi:hypothetical protein